MGNLLDYICYHKKWHGNIQNWRKKATFSINELLIKNIFNKLDIIEGVFVEFGAWDGVINSNARQLFLNGWQGLFIESDKKRFEELKQNYKHETNIFLSDLYVDDKLNIFDDIVRNSINKKIDFLSIDIDGLDIKIFQTIEEFLPLVVCIEGGQILEPYYEIVSDEVAKNNIQQSLNGMKNIFKQKGYTLLCAYQDAFFIKDEFSYLFNITNDIFDLYINGLIALPRIPYIKQLLDKNKLKNRIIDYIIKDLDLIKLKKTGEYGSALDKSVWVDKHCNYLKNQLIELKTLRKKYPYDEHNETLWAQIPNKYSLQ